MTFCNILDILPTFLKNFKQTTSISVGQQTSSERRDAGATLVWKPESYIKLTPAAIASVPSARDSNISPRKRRANGKVSSLCSPLGRVQPSLALEWLHFLVTVLDFPNTVSGLFVREALWNFNFESNDLLVCVHRGRTSCAGAWGL